jgi:DNA-binding NarL/FixJ family response regulator
VTAPLRVLLVDDHAMVRSGFAMVLSVEDDIEVVGEAADGSQALSVVTRTRPDVVLMDVRMPGLDGIEATRRIRCGPHPAKVIILTTFDLDEYVLAGLRAGASGFLLKDAPTDEVVQAVRAVAAGDAVLAPAVTRQLLDQVGLSSAQPVISRRGASQPTSPQWPTSAPTTALSPARSCSWRGSR